IRVSMNRVSQEYQGVAGISDRPASNAYKHYTLVVLALIYASSFMDRQITSILLEDLKAEFLLNDTQLGLLSGLAFALFYATLGVPIARLADRINRVNIIAVAVTIWSVMTALSSVAGSFTQLLLARVGVGVGEAGANPPSHSIISNYYGPKDRPMALSVWAMGSILGSILGTVLGGYIAEHYGWRMAFLILGIPGIGLAVLLKLTVREPPREGESIPEKSAASVNRSFTEVLKYLRSNPGYVHSVGAHVVAVFFGYSCSAWLPAFYLRNWDIGQSEVGVLFGTVLVAGGVTGLIAGGWMTRKMAERDKGWEAWVSAISLLLAAPAFAISLNTDSLLLASVSVGVAFFFYQCTHGPGLALVQSSVDSDVRATAAAIMYLLSNLLALGIGPLIVGYISDLSLGASAGRSLGIGMHFGVFALIAGSAWFGYLGFLWRRLPG
ncbi:MAG: MFS transporter, partial [Pseudomonadota bacterium]